MALPTSGPLSISQIRNEEVNVGGMPSTYSLRQLSSQAGKGTPDSISEFYGYSAVSIVTSGLILNMDASNSSSYPGSGNIWYDISGNGRVATLNGYGGGSTPTYSSLGGGSILFNRSSATADSAAAFSLSQGGTPWADLTSAVTLSLWFYTGTSSVMILAGKGFQTSPGLEYQSYQFYTNGSSIIGRVVGPGSTAFTDVGTTFSFNTWTNVTLTYNGSSVIVYKNGTAANSASKTGAITNVYGWPFVIGGQYNANGGYNLPTDGLNGYIGQTMLYNRALSSTEVLQNFNATRTRYGV